MVEANLIVERRAQAIIAGVTPTSFKCGDKVKWIYPYAGPPLVGIICVPPPDKEDQALATGERSYYVEFPEHYPHWLAWWALRPQQCKKGRM